VDDVRGLRDLEQAELVAAGDVQQDPRRALDRFLEQRRRDRDLGRLGGAVLAGFAVGRFARASGQSIYDTDDWDSGPSRGPIRDSSGRFRSRGEWSEGRDESDDGPSGSRRYPSRSQGYAGGGMGSGSSGTAGQRSGGPSSDDDASVGTSAGAGGIGSGSISTGES